MSKDRDGKLRQQVQAAIESDAEMKNYGIQSDVINGEVQLSGIVETISERNKLKNIVSRVQGVKRIENGITIATDGQINDRGVEMEVSEELKANPKVNLKHIGAKSVDGRVFLVGNTENPEEEQAAIESASKARGVVEVISQVKHRPKEKNLEELFHSQVENDHENGEFKGL